MSKKFKLLASVTAYFCIVSPVHAQVSSNITGEYLWNGGLLQINAYEAYDLGITGKGVTVAVIDTGVNYYHPELFTQIADGGYDFYNNKFDYFDLNGHGTLVAGIIAAKKDDYGIHGLAYNSRVMPIKVTNDDGSELSLDALKWGLYHAIQEDVDVINYSGTYATGDGFVLNDFAIEASTVFAYTALDDHIIAAPTGNSGAANPLFPALLPYVTPEHHNTGVYSFDTTQNTNAIDWSYSKGNIIAVAAAEQSGVISDFSNRCGVAADWCITAPGEDIISTFWYDSYIDMKGTSISTAYVSASIALLKEAFPNLTNAQLITLLFSTANKNGVYADKATYGQGFLDIGAAIQPQGDFLIARSDGQSSNITLQNSYISSGGAFGNSLNTALTNQDTIIHDQFDRPYKASFNSTLSENKIHYFSNVEKMNYLNFANSMQTHQLRNGLSFTSYAQSSSEPLDQGKWSYRSGDYSLSYSKGDAVFHDDINAQSVDALKLRLFRPAYLDMATNGNAYGWGYSLSENTNITFGYRNGESAYDDDLNANAFTANIHFGAADQSFIDLSYGLVNEDSSVLGMTSGGAFSFADHTKTHYIGANARAIISDDIALLGSFYIGETFAQGGRESLIEDVSTISHRQAAIGIEKTNSFHDQDRMTLVFEQPLRVTDGSLSIDAFNEGGDGFDLDLAPQAQEQNLHFFYDLPVSARNGHIGAEISYSHNSGHIKGESDKNFLLHYKTSF